MLFRTANLSQLAEFDEVIDVRTPAEFAEDHIPGARNCPVLSDEERIQVGTVYKQVSPFEARKLGGALVARNIAHHLETVLRDKPKSWKPLVYCWRGGQRSGAMSIILNQIGWAAYKLEGGYKTYRHHVLDQLDQLPARFHFHVLCGATGSGKSRLLAALARQGAQVLDLEGLAQHRGSVLGSLPQHPQPSQKWFESVLLTTLQAFDPARPVYVESESKKIGLLRLPELLLETMHRSPCILLETRTDARVQALLEDYRHLTESPQKLLEQLDLLRAFHSKEKFMSWQQLVERGEYSTLVHELLTNHYDPIYLRSLAQHYAHLEQSQRMVLDDLEPQALEQNALALIKREA